MKSPMITAEPAQVREALSVMRWVQDASLVPDDEFEISLLEMADSFRAILPAQYLAAFLMKDLMLSVCAWHENGKETSTLLAAEFAELTHGICDNCRNKMRKTLSQ